MSKISRRRLLASTGLVGVGVVGAAGAGAVVAALANLPDRSPAQPRAVAAGSASPPPAGLVSALAREQQLIAAVETALAAAPGGSKASVLTAVAADHHAHSDALAALIGAPAPASGSSAPRSTAGASIEALAVAEQDAHGRAVAESQRLTGAAAVLLASIAACEAAHVELLT